MCEISIVSGTYNRLGLLKNMVASVRLSVGVGISYEIVLVDGGSTDGTIAWCKGEKDIVLIEQGELLGAVSAFNTGAQAAKGKYVILANDDIEFVYESIQRALAYMQDNPMCGIGCFYQDRGKQNWHTSKITVNMGNMKTEITMGQVCIVPKWLGDRVGWWGDYLWTYGGDNELTCNVAESGFTTDPIPCACIHDITFQDLLRYKNSFQQKDSYKWVAKWPNNPTVGKKRIPAGEIVEMKNKPRLLYAPIYEETHPVQLQQKHGLRDALAKYFTVSEVNYAKRIGKFGAGGAGGVDDLLYTSEAFKPHVYLLQCHYSRPISPREIATMKSHSPDALFINWNGDYTPGALHSDEYKQMLRSFDIVTFCTADIEEEYKKAGVNWAYWQIGYEDYKEESLLPDDPKYDVLLLGNEYSAKRTRLGLAIKSVKEANVGVYGEWRTFPSNGENMYDFVQADKLYRNSKIGIGDQQWEMSVGYVSNRLFQALRAGSFFLQQRIPRMGELMGFVDGEHFVCWDAIEEVPDLIRYWLDQKRDAERKEIADNGKKFVLARHSFGGRVDELMQLIARVPEKGVALERLLSYNKS